MTSPSSPKKLNPSHVVLIAGLVLSLLVVMFRPAGAEAVLPTSVDVFETSETDSAPATVKVGDLPEINNVDYSVILHGKKKPTTVGLSGVPLIEFLKAGGVKTDDVQFVKVRYGTTDDSVISLIPLNQSDTERPPIILSSGKKPGLGPFKTPAVVPGQPDLSKAISEDSFVPFSTKGARLKIVPGAPGAKIMSVRVTAKKRKNGEYTLSAKVSGGGSGSKSFQWYGFDSKGNPVKLDTGPSIETKDATSGTSQHLINVVVSERGTGSTGAGSVEYTSRKKAKGATKNPYPDPTPATTNTITPGITQQGTNGIAGAGGSVTTIPPSTANQPIPQQTVTPTDATTVPTAPTTSSATSIDSTAITNTAQNVSGTGGLKTVTGVLLSAPTVSAAAAGGGSPINALPAPVATQLNSIFQPVNDADDAWAYLLALLFAFSFSGAVREWVKP
ncbi:MAG: hypothetical protein JHD02_03950 [Thermoleophilaceae bacterium]|nr:hypothetical protein [Thermoleophilaceae bacterium]